MRILDCFRISISTLACGFGLLLLAGCAGNPDALPSGTPRDKVLATYGTPTAIWPLALSAGQSEGLGERLQYSNQPWGQQVYNVDLDSSGRVAATAQVMTQTAFAAVQIDTWRTQDVRRAFGKPALVARVHSFDGSVWSYRYAEPFGLNKQFHVFMDATGLVKRTQVTDEPDPADDRIMSLRR
jgi:outer membrane protein assembly factor BamE (lipoprotein component of BamABCDE complex)